MNWQDAIKALKEGKKVRQKVWSEGCYIFIGKYNTIELSGEYAAEAHQHLDIVDEIANAFQETLNNNWEIADSQGNDLEPQIIKNNSDKMMYFSERFYRIVSDAWCNQKYTNDIKLLSRNLIETYPDTLPLPYIFPYKYSSINLEWHINYNDTSLEICLESNKAHWHNHHIITDQVDEFDFDLTCAKDWSDLYKKLNELKNVRN